ncbi:hypothetical protein BNJ_00033 [Kaumoebavirus]|uniref:hypothetical protein n=1 Tax=Kaumoebavirus TaxID=1859492 RepID=UPI0009C21056|nr:hypothetical protein BNJ_00033 [Kaumoebavirus]ARA71876.1 hypothetical protein BNJ_00033 [Kaumoebavirus]
MTWVVICSTKTETRALEYENERVARKAAEMMREAGAYVTVVAVLNRAGTIDELEQLEYIMDAVTGGAGYSIKLNVSKNEIMNHRQINHDFDGFIRKRQILLL